MDGEELKVCPNCKREIPAVNFTTHTVHCARNIKVCPVCKEPVPNAELADHHDKLHKLLPCKQCGEKVCGTDLEDHVRDSCGHTVKSCRYCSLELPRREIPAHENYCGVRTEQCPECREWVMIKYRQLHEDSNHGFLRLDDDPIPIPKKTVNIPKVTNLPKSTNISQPSTSNSVTNVKNTNLYSDRPRTEMRYFNGPSSSSGSNDLPSGSRSNGVPPANIPSVSRTDEATPANLPGSSKTNGTTPVLPGGSKSNIVTPDIIPSSSKSNGVIQDASNRPTSAQNVYNGVGKMPLKRTNDQPQINTAVTAPNKVEKDLAISRGAVKKRPAPRPPARDPPADPRRDLAYYSALQRNQQEERQRQEQNSYNLAHGLPPVLSAAAKLDKLRKMDALHNREADTKSYKNCLQGRVWMDTASVPIGNTLGSSSEEANNGHLEVDRRREVKQNRQSDTNEDRRNDFKDVKPMTPEQFMDRFKELQLRKDRDDRSERSGDRFSEIKSSLRELRRGLNEVTAPYNSNNTNLTNNSERSRRTGRVSPGVGGGDTLVGGGDAVGGAVGARPEDDEVRLPCEFCGAPVLAHDLVLHQTGCRPDLTQYRPPPPPPPLPYLEPVIPCEFCTESLPVYLISEHQERCGREANLLYPD